MFSYFSNENEWLEYPKTYGIPLKLAGSADIIRDRDYPNGFYRWDFTHGIERERTPQTPYILFDLSLYAVWIEDSLPATLIYTTTKRLPSGIAISLLGQEHCDTIIKLSGILNDRGDIVHGRLGRLTSGNGNGINNRLYSGLFVPKTNISIFGQY